MRVKALSLAYQRPKTAYKILKKNTKLAAKLITIIIWSVNVGLWIQACGRRL
jgi:hypothetical protein